MTKQIVITAIVALVISLAVVLAMPTKTIIQSNLGGLSERDVQAVSLKLGDSGTKHTKFLSGTCDAATTELPLEATSTDSFTCSATGVRSGDKVFVSLPYSTGYDVVGGLVHNGDATVTASNVISFHILNQSGTATSSFALATTSVQWWAIDN